MRAHNCDLLQCRKTVDGLEKWACEDCVPDTPDCIEYQNRRLRRNLSKKAERRAARSRKEFNPYTEAMMARDKWIESILQVSQSWLVCS